jgi:hypothetical protein
LAIISISPHRLLLCIHESGWQRERPQGSCSPPAPCLCPMVMETTYRCLTLRATQLSLHEAARHATKHGQGRPMLRPELRVADRNSILGMCPSCGATGGLTSGYFRSRRTGAIFTMPALPHCQRRNHSCHASPSEAPVISRARPCDVPSSRSSDAGAGSRREVGADLPRSCAFDPAAKSFRPCNTECKIRGA